MSSFLVRCLLRLYDCRDIIRTPTGGTGPHAQRRPHVGSDLLCRIYLDSVVLCKPVPWTDHYLVKFTLRFAFCGDDELIFMITHIDSWIQLDSRMFCGISVALPTALLVNCNLGLWEAID